VLVLTLAAVAVTAFVMRQRWAAAAAPEQHDAASTPSSMPSSRIPGKALAEAIIQANHGLSSEEIWSRPAIEPSTAIAGFPAHPAIACFACFEAEHRLNKGVVRKLYTNEEVPYTSCPQAHRPVQLPQPHAPLAQGIFEQLNLALAAAERRPCGTAAVIYTQVRPRPRDTLGGMVGSG
jgi:hypothetical protein